MKASIAIVSTLVVGAGLGLAATAMGSEKLANDKGCMTCHDGAAKKIGPSFKESAAKFKGKEADLVKKLGAHHNGAKASEDERKALAAWILTQ